MSYQHLTDEMLVNGLLHSDSKAFEEIYLRYWKRIFRYAMSRISKQEVVEDICHEVFLSVWQRRGVSGINNLEAYLIQSAKFAILNYYKAEFSNEKHLNIYAQYIKSEYNETDYPAFLNNLQEAWITALESLSDKTKTIFKFSRLDYLTNKEIAQRLQLSEKAVEYHISKALVHLREKLGDFLI